MELSVLKAIPIDDYLASKGHRSTSKINGKSWYKAVWNRSDSTASVCVDSRRNTFMDFGNGRGGSVIDMVMYVEDLTVKDAIELLRTSKLSPCAVTISPEQREVSLTVDKVIPVSSWMITDYIVNKRGINLYYVYKYCKEVHFTTKQGSKFYGVGFPTDGGGWEIRNPITKTSISPKTPTVINPRGKTVSVFEGWIDFLSACMYYGRDPQNTVIVLNSVANVAKVNWSAYDKAYLFLDNDRAGSFTTGIISDQLSSVDMRGLYSGYDDFNDFLIKNK